MSDIILTITNVGRAALVNAEANGTAPVRISHCGVSATAVAPTTAATSLPGEIKKIATISGEYVGDDTIHLVVRDETTDAYSLRSFGLYLSDGTLFAIYGQSATIMEKSAQAILLLALDASFMDVNASSITFGATNFSNPPATTERQGVVELATLPETIAGLDGFRVPSARENKSAVSAWLDSRFGTNNALIWHPDNDGAGSGLDADLLDGQQGSYYTNIAGRLGFTPANKAGDTFGGAIRRDAQYYLDLVSTNPVINLDSNDYLSFDRTGNALSLVIGGQTRMVQRGAGNLDFYATGAMRFNDLTVWNSGNDGAGSGLDADLLDGLDSSYFTNIAARLGFTPANKAGDTFGGAIRRDANYYLDLLNSNPMISFDATDYLSYDRAGNALSLIIGGQTRMVHRLSGNLDFFATGAMRFNDLTVWTSGNDGAGSGLDADLLDGQDGSYYANIIDRLGYTPANKGGDTFGGAIRRDANYYLDLVSTNPVINFDGNDYLSFDRAGNALSLVIGGQTRMVQRSTGNLDFYATGAMLFNGLTVWTSGNDGAGSGLDADLLDGQDGAYYSNIAGRLGFTPANKAGDTFGGAIRRDAQYYLDLVNANPLISFDGTDYLTYDRAGNALSLVIGDQTRMVHRLTGDLDFYASGGMMFNGLPAWNGGNDGSGSGLDADLLDGHQADAFSRIVSQNMAAIDGYRVYADGTKECWTRIAIGQHQYATWTLPVEHESFVHPSLGCTTAGGNNEVQDNTGITTINGTPPTSITFWNADDRTITVWVRTIGR